MKKITRKIALYLSVIMAVLAVAEFSPARDAQAATVLYDLSWTKGVYNDETKENSLQVEVGSQFQLGQLVYVEKMTAITYDVLKLVNFKGATYASSAPSVATIASNGTLTAKAVGKTNLTVRFEGKETTCNLTVVKAGALGSGITRIKKITSLAKKVVKLYGRGVTSSNRYAVSQAVCEWWLQLTKSTVMSDYAYGFREDSEGKVTNKLVSPACLYVDIVLDKLENYANRNNPIATAPGKSFQISSVSGKKNTRTITINLKKKVSARQIFAIKQVQWFESRDSYVERDRRACFDIKVQDTKTGHTYWGKAVTYYNSKKITISMDYLKLKSGRRYRVIGLKTAKNMKYGWTLGKTFKAK